MNHQIKRPLDIEISIPSDDPVRLLSAFVEEMDLSDLYAIYERIRKNQATPCQMLKISIYAAMNRIYSSRDIESSCKIFGGFPAKTSLLTAPRSNPLPTNTLLSGKRRYPPICRNCQKRSALFCAECEELYGFKIVYDDQISIRTLKRLKKKLEEIKKKKTSYSFTESGKEKRSCSGQQKPAYNLQHGVDSEYVKWLDIYPNPTDTLTLILFLKDMEKHFAFKYKNIVADAGYESVENYVFLEKNGQAGYIKPQNYELSKQRNFHKDISR